MNIKKKQYTRPPEGYSYQGSDFNLIKSSDTVGLYQQVGRTDHFEVILLNKRGEFPSSSKWGTYGFTYWSRSVAEDRFCRLAGLPIVKRLRDGRTRAAGTLPLKSGDRPPTRNSVSETARLTPREHTVLTYLSTLPVGVFYTGPQVKLARRSDGSRYCVPIPDGAGGMLEIGVSEFADMLAKYKELKLQHRSSQNRRSPKLNTLAPVN